MRKIAAGMFVSLDGVVEAPENWTFDHFTDEIGDAITSSMATADTLLLGRKTYQEFADVWPGRGTDDPIGAFMNNTPKVVASTTLDKVEWQNSTLITGDVIEEVAKLKQQPGKNINMTGSATLVRSLLQAKLLDELWLMVFPVVLGSGTRLFAEGEARLSLKLAASQTFSTGVQSLTYTPADA